MRLTGSGSATVVVTNPVCPLTVSLTSPSSGATVSNTITLAATASTCATRVDFYCDSVTTPIGTATSTPFTTPCNTTTMPNGSHSFYAKAYDAAGNATTSAANTVTVNNQVVQSGPWAKAFGGSSTVYGCAVAVEANTGNIVMGGYFAGTADFGAGLLTSAGGYDIFLAKYSPAGACLWSKRFGSAAGSEMPKTVALDSNGNIFVAGTFAGTIDVGGGALPNAGQNDIFLVKYSASGQYLWSKSFGGPGMDVVNSIAIDGSGNVIMTGSFDTGYPGLSFGGASIIAWDNTDIYVAKLAGTDGHQIWAENFRNQSSDISYAVAVDGQGDVFITGSFNNIIDFGGGNLGSSGGGNIDVYVAKLSGATGSYLWARNFGDVYPDSGVALATDLAGDVFVTGYYNSATIDFGCGNPNPAKLAGNSDAFLAKLSGANGSCKWSKSFSGPGDKGPRAVAVDNSGNVVVAGVFPYSINIGGTLLTASGTSDTFLAKFSSSGSLVSATHFGGTGASTSSSGLATDAAGNMVLTGYLYGTANLGGTSLSSTPSGDAFLLRLNP